MGEKKNWGLIVLVDVQAKMEGKIDLYKWGDRVEEEKEIQKLCVYNMMQIVF